VPGLRRTADGPAFGCTLVLGALPDAGTAEGVVSDLARALLDDGPFQEARLP
jgi:hypothetical protein